MSENDGEPMLMSEWDLLEVDSEYSIAYQITNLAPFAANEAIEYYEGELAKTELYRPEEYAVIHLALAKIHFTSMVDDIAEGSKEKIVEKCLKHLKKAIKFFTYDSYPLVFATLCILIAHTLREQYSLVTISKVNLAKQATLKSEYLRKGIELLSEAQSIFKRYKDRALEYAVCSLDTGLLHLLQLEDESNGRNKEGECNVLREYAVISLEEAEHQLDMVRVRVRVRVSFYNTKYSVIIFLTLTITTTITLTRWNSRIVM
jgi:hypothetical protein